MNLNSTELILNHQVSRNAKVEQINIIMQWIESGSKGRYFVCANPHSMEIARMDLCFDAAIKNADLAIPDGIGILIASKILGGKIRERVTGMDIFLGLSASLNERGGYRYFFLGSTEDNLAKIKERMQKDFPEIKIIGMYSPPFKNEFSEADNSIMIKAINEARPDVLWVGMTAPKQEKWIYLNKDKLDVKFIGAVGAVFDFYSGNVRRSHPWFLKHGLEWLPRLIRQPIRLWKRTFVSAPLFILHVIKQRYKLNG